MRNSAFNLLGYSSLLLIGYVDDLVKATIAAWLGAKKTQALKEQASVH